MSWRDELAKRLEDATSLDSVAKDARDGVEIDRSPQRWWTNKAAEQPNPLDGTRLWDNS